MSEDSALAVQEPDPLPDHPATGAAPPGLLALFLAFARMSLAGFGGVLVFARRAIVEQHRWMNADEFNETFALCHFLPGPNIVNLSMVFGQGCAALRRSCRLCRAVAAADADHDGARDHLRPFWQP